MSIKLVGRAINFTTSWDVVERDGRLVVVEVIGNDGLYNSRQQAEREIARRNKAVKKTA